jgi:DNA polymerase
LARYDSIETAVATQEQLNQFLQQALARPLPEDAQLGPNCLLMGEGNPQAGLLLIGEAPGEEEITQRRPFVGPAGRLLDRALGGVGLKRAQIYITNVVHWRPMVKRGTRIANRPPRVSEIKACAPWRDQEIALVDPKVIVCLGATPAKALIAKDFKMTQLRGRIFDCVDGRRCLASFHPAYLLRLMHADPATYETAYQNLIDDLWQARTLADST